MRTLARNINSSNSRFWTHLKQNCYKSTELLKAIKPMYDSPEITPNYTRDYPNDSWQQTTLDSILSLGHPRHLRHQPAKHIPIFPTSKTTTNSRSSRINPEQISRQPQPKIEPEIPFSNIQPGSDIFQIPQQQRSFPRLPSAPTTPSVTNLPRTSVTRLS